MPTYVLIHGAGDSAFYWHLVERELRARGHDVVAVDLPCDDETAGWTEYTDTVVAAIGDRKDLIVVAHSLGGFTAPLVCARVPVELLVLVAAMVPRPGEKADGWSAAAGLDKAARDDEEAHDGSDLALFYHDVPPALAAEALRHGRAQSSTPFQEPWPLAAWPDVPTRFLVCRHDRIFPAAWLRELVRDRLGIVADEIESGHCPALSRPEELTERLEAYRAELPSGRVRYADAFDAEIRPHNERLRAAAGIRPGERVLDIGCGTGESTRQAAAAAAPGDVLGVDVSGPMLERARALTAAARLGNARYEEADAQVHPFAADHFDVAISRFGVMFFADPVAAFRNIERALRPGGRLALLVWQRRELNEWTMEIHRALEADAPAPPALAAFSLGDAEVARGILERAGFGDIDFAEVHEPVFYGADAGAALQLVRSFQTVRDALASMARAAAARAEQRLHDMIAAHQRGDRGVLFDSHAWIITAVTRRRGRAA
jgi:ubiquinone/menaquinone biosynthesis C-methylase UbiE/pimeloyl-ACP methyl ester carboxylesterase